MANGAPNKKSFLQKLGKFFLTTVLGGLFVILPISIFIIIIRFALNFLMNIISPLSNLLRIGEATPKWTADLMAMIIITLVFFIIGLIVQMPRGKAYFKYIERKYLEMIPMYSTIRETVNQFTGKSTTPFSQVVMADVFGNDTRMVGFITDELPNDMYSIFVPTGPNPTNGFVFHVKGHQLEFIDARSEDAMRSIIAVGTGTKTMLSNADLDRLKKKEKVSKEQEQIQNDMYHGPAAGTQVPT
jgi:uncharacterized membrane protein